MALVAGASRASCSWMVEVEPLLLKPIARTESEIGWLGPSLERMNTLEEAGGGRTLLISDSVTRYAVRLILIGMYTDASGLLHYE